MASINLSGVLRDPLGEVSYGNKMRFTHNTTTGETVKGFRSSRTIEINGEYDFDVEYGNVHIESMDFNTGLWIDQGVITINSDTPATSIPALLGITTPLSDPELLIVQNLVADAEAAKNEAQTAQTETEALFNDFDSNVEDVAIDTLASIGSNVSFEATFNDSLNISKGYGSHDTITVGGDTVELPSKSVDFSCASERTVLNKSGITESVDVDSPAIGDDGVWCHGAYGNILTHSSDMTQSSWVGTSTITESGEFCSDNENKLYEINDVTGSGQNASQIFSADLSTGFCRSFEIKNVNATSTSFTLQGGGISPPYAVTIMWDGEDIDSVDVSQSTSTFNYEKLNDGLWRVSLFTSDDLGDVISARTYIYPGAFGATAQSSVLVGNNQLTNAGTPLPFVKTEASQVSVAKTVSSIPVMNNLPAAGQPFAVEVDCSMPSSTNESVVFRQVRSTSTGLFLRRQASGLIQFGIAADGITKTADFSGDYGKHKYVCKYDGIGNIYLYEDGSQVATNTTNTPTYDLNVALNIGNDSSYSLNGQLKNFRIHHGDVSADTIKSWGGAK